MQILGLIAVISWIVMGAAAIEVSRALGKQVCIGRLFFPCAILEFTKTIKHKASSAIHWCYCCLVSCVCCRAVCSSQHTTAHQCVLSFVLALFFIAFI